MGKSFLSLLRRLANRSANIYLQQYIISKYPDRGYERVQNLEGGSARVIYITGGPPPPSAGPTAGAHSTTQAGYGTIAGAPKTQGGNSSQRIVTQQPSKGSEQAMPKFSNNDAAGPSEGGPAPPSYAEVVQGDHKIQSHA